MVAVELPDEIWEKIFNFVRRPNPPVRSKCIQKHYHQHDLVSSLTVNKGFFQLAGKSLYTNPIVDDPLNFFSGLSELGTADNDSFKLELLKHVRTLDLNHKQDARDHFTKPFYDMDKEEQEEWYADFYDKSTTELLNLSNTVKILETPYVKEKLQKMWNENQGIDCLRIGLYDNGWWYDKLTQIKYNHTNRLNQYERCNFYELPDILYNQLTDQNNENTETFGSTLLTICNPKSIEQYIMYGPISVNRSLFNNNNDGLRVSHRLKSVISHMEIDLGVKGNFGYLPNISPGKINEWHFSIQRSISNRITQEDDTLSENDENGRKIKMLYDIFEHLAQYEYSVEKGYNQETLLKIHNLDRLLPIYSAQATYDGVNHIDIRNFIQTFQDIRENLGRSEPQSISDFGSDEIIHGRFGPWGMMLVTCTGIQFVDINNTEQKVKVIFISSNSK
ncbi:uncharacterized protein L201_000170 [Kwoniella dendrophila CBS 6074]|uniref:F-box domain-containing protein n=1 Tax=Kwoniella dendrophila CBS 6074 TaxID=1295534 RepID=A0AAX4JK69_9TREE